MMEIMMFMIAIILKYVVEASCSHMSTVSTPQQLLIQRQLGQEKVEFLTSRKQPRAGERGLFTVRLLFRAATAAGAGIGRHRLCVCAAYGGVV